MTAVIPSHQETKTIRRIGIAEISKDIYGAPVHRNDILQHWKMKRGTTYQELHPQWRIHKSEHSKDSRLFYVIDHEGNRRAMISTGILDKDRVLRGYPSVYNRFTVCKTSSGRQLYFIRDRRQSNPLFGRIQHPTEAVLVKWLETHLPNYKDPFAYWDLDKEKFNA